MIISNINHELCRFNAHSFSISHAHTTRAHLGLVVPRLVLPWACPGGKKIKNSLRSRSKSFAGLSRKPRRYYCRLPAIFHFKYYSQGYTWAWVSYKRIDLGRFSPNTSPANGSPMWCSVSSWVHVHMLLCCGDSPYPVTSPGSSYAFVFEPLQMIPVLISGGAGCWLLVSMLFLLPSTLILWSLRHHCTELSRFVEEAPAAKI